MSTYLGYRRRYSAPEKPEPRFQWRLRVHSLMMDDSDTTPPLSDRRAQRRDSSGSYRFSDETQQVEAEQSNRGEAVATTHRTRRERFTRTKSEGHLKLRVRFSKFSDESKSCDDGDDEQPDNAEPDRRRQRSSSESGIDSSGDTHVDEDDVQSEENQDNSVRQCEDSVDIDDGVVCEEASEASAANAATGWSGNVNDGPQNEKDISLGAIPKRYPNTGASKSHSPLRREGDRERGVFSTAESSSYTEETIAKYEDLCSGTSEKTDKLKCSSLDSDCGRRSTQPSVEREAPSQYTEDGDYDSGADEATGRRQGGKNNGDQNLSTENTNNADDIESIIEQIIAEEEAVLAGEKSNSSKMKTLVEGLDGQAIKTMTSQMEKLDDNTHTEKEDETNGINIERSVSQDKHGSSSLPSYQHNEDSDLSRSLMPFSSSCPSSKKGKPNSNIAKDKEEEDLEDDGWAYLPVILLEDVFTLLSPKERHQASQVCRQWLDLFYSPRVWETFILLERTLTKKRFNLYKGYQRELCPGKTQLCFRRVGSYFKKIVVTPITDYFNLYEFLRILAAFLQYQEDHGLTAMPLLHTFDFTFACASRGDGEVIVHGTGGQILEMIKQLLIRISNLKHLKLNQLLIDDLEVPGLFDAMTNCFGECLNSLEMLNVTKVPFGLTDLAHFRNLVKLTVSPQHLNEEVLLLIAGLNLLQLHLMQDPYTCECEPVSCEAWKLVREMAPWLRVFLEVSGNTRAQLLIQPRAPVYGVFLRTPYSRLTSDLVMAIVENYCKTLRYFVQERLPRVHGPRGIDVRCDSSLLFLVRRCQALHTLMIRERISTSTLILIASEGKKLLTLIVRRNGLIKRCDWPQPGAWTKEFYSRLKSYALDYDKCVDEVCALLRQRWRPLTDKQFMRLKIIPKVEGLKWR